MTIFKKLTISICFASIFLASCVAQLQNAKTENVKIYGNCEMCETTIEAAGNLNSEVKVDWNKDTKIATITYDSSKSNQNEILKRIALAGYDSEKFRAPDDVYNRLKECCQYERIQKSAAVQNEVLQKTSEQNHDETTNLRTENLQNTNKLKTIFDNYFELKNALVKSDGRLAASVAKDLLSYIAVVDIDKLTPEEHVIWTKTMGNLKSNTDKIATSTSIENQRKSLNGLSENFYELIKASKQESVIYYQNCPMYNDGNGGSWLSQETVIRNPYFGSQMLTCGKIIEIIR